MLAGQPDYGPVGIILQTEMESEALLEKSHCTEGHAAHMNRVFLGSAQGLWSKKAIRRHLYM